MGRTGYRYREFAMIVAAFMIALIWVGRLQFDNTLFLYASVLLVGLLANAVIVPLDSDIFEYGRRVGDPLTASMYRNTSYMLMQLVLYGTLFLLINVFDASFAIACLSMFALVTVNTIYVLTMRKR